jgi:hypothetical protein
MIGGTIKVFGALACTVACAWGPQQAPITIAGGVRISEQVTVAHVCEDWYVGENRSAGAVRVEWRTDGTATPASLELSGRGTDRAFERTFRTSGRSGIEVRNDAGQWARVSPTSQRCVPPVPPDSLPRDFYDSRNQIKRTPASTQVRGAVAVEFVAGSSVGDRTLAIQRVRGRLVGGHRIGPDGGVYTIIVGASDAGDDVERAIAALRAFPSVRAAIAEVVRRG